MCKHLIHRIEKVLDGRTQDVDPAERTRIAVGALLVECARIDSSYSDADRQAVADALTGLFDLDPEVTDALVAVAEKRSEEVWHDWILTQAVKRGFDADGRRALIAELWRITQTNGVLENREQGFIERIARELELSEEDVEALRAGAEVGGR
ncbi:MAG: TerB family tellurite resistance protein [Actinomycetota bacterium]|nr:TerB family tellurite resistance protein [Actinomycetota bacterium]